MTKTYKEMLDEFELLSDKEKIERLKNALLAETRASEGYDGDDDQWVYGVTEGYQSTLESLDEDNW